MTACFFVALASNLVGFAGLALISATIAGDRLAWLLPFCYLAIVYLAAPRRYDMERQGSVLCWLMYPARFTETFIAAGVLFAAGLASYLWAGHPPRPGRHPLR